MPVLASYIMMKKRKIYKTKLYIQITVTFVVKNGSKSLAFTFINFLKFVSLITALNKKINAKMV